MAIKQHLAGVKMIMYLSPGFLVNSLVGTWLTRGRISKPQNRFRIWALARQPRFSVVPRAVARFPPILPHPLVRSDRSVSERLVAQRRPRQ